MRRVRDVCGPRHSRMNVFAIDPGPRESAYVVLKDGKVDCGMVRSNHEIRQLIRQGSHKDCSVMAIEMIACYGMPVGKETFETCLWIGRFIEANTGSLDRPKDALVYRKDIKIHLCGTMKAKDANIRQSLIDKLGAPGTKANPGATYGVTGHLWAALAVAVYASEKGTSGLDL